MDGGACRHVRQSRQFAGGHARHLRRDAQEGDERHVLLHVSRFHGAEVTRDREGGRERAPRAPRARAAARARRRAARRRRARSAAGRAEHVEVLSRHEGAAILRLEARELVLGPRLAAKLPGPLRAEDLANAWADARSHREEIELEISENEED